MVTRERDAFHANHCSGRADCADCAEEEHVLAALDDVRGGELVLGKRAADAMRIGYPIAIDSEQRIWNAFDNRAWPALYFIDARGHVRHHVLGEGGYDASERLIQAVARGGRRSFYVLEPR